MPQALGITIPMALLVGILIALGRLSGDREIVAMEACGVSLGRLLRPLLLFALVATAATTYVMIVALPAANQAFREITFKLLMTRGETKIKPRVFYTGFPNLVIYVREVTPGVGWTDVMVSESSTPTQPKTYLAKKGRLLLDEGEAHRADGADRRDASLREPRGAREIRAWHVRADDARDRSRERVSAHGPMKGPTEMTIAELKDEMADLRKQNIYPHNQIMAWQKKYSIPAACLAFMLVALGMGVSHRRDGRLASFVLGIGVVFVYWVLMYMSEAIAKAGAAALLVCVARDVGAERRRRAVGRRADREEVAGSGAGVYEVRAAVRAAPRACRGGAERRAAPARRGTRVIVVIRIPHVAFPRPSILDWYVLKQGLRVSVLPAAALLGAVLHRELHRLVRPSLQGTNDGVHRW